MSQCDARAVILAAGTSSRVGGQKLLMNFRGRPLIEHALGAAAHLQPVVVAGRELVAYLAGREGVVTLLNARPELGMTHSLAIANRFVHPTLTLAVLLGDKPLVTPALIGSICAAAEEADCVYPVRGDEPGHPVVISTRARARIESLPSGDTLRMLRDDPQLRSQAIQTDDPGAYFDVDTAEALEA